MSETDELSEEAELPSIVLRDHKLDDCQEIVDIYNESILAGDANMECVLKTIDDIREIMENFNDRETYLVLEKNGSIIGWGIIKRYSDRLGYRQCCETSVYLKREVRLKGYGSVIKKALIDRCREYGYHHLVAKIFAGNAVSIEYNKKFGYEMVGIQKEVGYINGRWQDIVIMQLILQDVPPLPDVETLESD